MLLGPRMEKVIYLDKNILAGGDCEFTEAQLPSDVVRLYGKGGECILLLSYEFLQYIDAQDVTGMDSFITVRHPFERLIVSV